MSEMCLGSKGTAAVLDAGFSAQSIQLSSGVTNLSGLMTACLVAPRGTAISWFSFFALQEAAV